MNSFFFAFIAILSLYAFFKLAKVKAHPNNVIDQIKLIDLVIINQVISSKVSQKKLMMNKRINKL